MKMQHSNVSIYSPNDNLYDITISKNSSSTNLPKKRFISKRSGSLQCSNDAYDQKRPSEYYLQKLSQPSTPSLKSLGPKENNSTTQSLHSLASRGNNALVSFHNRATSDSFEVTSDTGKDSDDAMSVISTAFDAPDSRLSSITNYSTYSYSNSKLSESAAFKKSLDFSLPLDTNSLDITAGSGPQITPILEKQTINLSEIDETFDHHSRSLSGSRSLSNATPKASTVSTSIRGFTKELSGPKPLKELPPTPMKLRATSSSSVELLSSQLSKQALASSSFGLTRAKTSYYSSKETKERKQQRKKLYEENDDDELLVNDIDLVFNVPVIKSPSEIFFSRRSASVPSVLLAQNDIVAGKDKCQLNSIESMKPCPLPGKLFKSSFSRDKPPNAIPEPRTLSREHTFASVENDIVISNNISEFYEQRSLSYSVIAKASREKDLADKMPNYVRAQCSVEDLSLVSCEKLGVLDQSRPINLPPKTFLEKTKHHLEWNKLLTGYETMAKQANSVRTNQGLSAATNQQEWLKLSLLAEGKAFDRRINNDREKWRKLSWDSLVSSRFRFRYFMKVLLAGTPKNFVESVKQNIMCLEAKAEALPRQMKSAKDADFNKMIEHVLQRPLYKNFATQAQETEGVVFDIDNFHQNFRRLLYIKSLSEGGLQKHHSIFIIPTFLILFQSTESFQNICLLIELFDEQIFSGSILLILNDKLSSWSDVSKMSQSNPIHKTLKNFSSLQEFENLSSTSLFELIIQLNDRTPLSLSAPPTPIVAQSPFRAFSRPSVDCTCANSSPCTTTDSVISVEDEQIYSASASLSLVGILLQLLVIYSRSKKKSQKAVNLLQSFLLTVFQYYHINWNSCGDLVRGNESIKLNNSSDQWTNLESFVCKWRNIYKKL